MFSCFNSLSNLIRYYCLLVPNAGLLTDPAVHNMILLQIFIGDEAHWDNLILLWVSVLFFLWVLFLGEAESPMVLGAAQAKSRHLLESISQHSTSQPAGCLGSGDENRDVWSPNTYPSASNCAQWEPKQVFQTIWGAETDDFVGMLFLVLINEKILWDEREQKNLMRSF